MIYLQQFDFKIKHSVSKKMPYVNYLFRLSVDHQILHKSENSNEEIFISQVCINRKAKYIMAFIYNAYGSWMSIRIDR